MVVFRNSTVYLVLAVSSTYFTYSSHHKSILYCCLKLLFYKVPVRTCFAVLNLCLNLLLDHFCPF